jgi:type II secretory pathway component PulJ
MTPAPAACGRRQSGFSTMEVVIAAAIFSAVMIPLLTLEMRITDNYLRYERATARATFVQNALAVLRDVNAMSEAEGRTEVGDGVWLEWRARPLSEERLSTGYPIGDGRHMVALYALDARVARAGGGELAAFTVERLGWRRASPDELARGVDGFGAPGP